MWAGGWLITILGSFQGLKVVIKYSLVNSTASVQGTRPICPSKKTFNLWLCRLIGNLIIAMLAHWVCTEANSSKEHLCNRMVSNWLKVWSAFTENTGYPISTNTWSEQRTWLFFWHKKNKVRKRGRITDRLKHWPGQQPLLGSLGWSASIISSFSGFSISIAVKGVTIWWSRDICRMDLVMFLFKAAVGAVFLGVKWNRRHG